MSSPTKVFINNHIIYGQKSPLTPTTDDFVANCKNLTTFLADNLTYNKPFEVPKFVLQQLLKKFEAQYTQNLQDKDIIAFLLKTEQTLSCLAGLSPIHEQQFLINLIPQTCFQDQISHVFLLLSKTIDPGQTRNSLKFKELIEFLVPFIKYLSTNDSDFAKFLAMDLESAKTLLKETIKTLREYLVLFETLLPHVPKEEDSEDLTALLEAITKFKDQVIQQKSSLNTNFYYTLGLCSFIAHLTNFVLKQDPIFLRILLFSSLFYNTLNDAIHHNNMIFNLDKKTLKPSSWLQALSSTDNRIQQSLDCLLTPLQVLHQDFSKVLTEENSDIQPVVLNLLQTLEKNKILLIERGCSLYDYFPNQYDFLVHEVLSLLSLLIKEAPLIESLKDEIKNKLLTTQELSFVTIAKCYSFLDTTEFNQNLPQVLFETHDEMSPIYLNYILKNILLNIDQITNLEEVYPTYLSKIETNGSSRNLIQVGVFLLNLLKALPSNNLNETTKKSFLISFIGFITHQQQQIEHWDIIQIQKNLWTLLGDIQEPIPSMPKFLLLLEKATTGPTPIQIETFPKTFSYTTPHTQKLIFDVILASLESIYANINTIWGQKGTTEKIQAINSELSRLTMFTIPWLSYLTSVLNLQAKFSLQKLYVLQTKLTAVYYHPASIFYLNSESRTQLLEAIKKSMEPKPIPKYTLNQAFYESLADFLSQTLQGLDENLNIINEGFTGLLLPDRSFPKFQAQFLEGKVTSKPYIMLQAALFALSEQYYVFTIHSKNPGCPLDDKYQTLLASTIKKTRTSLFKFLIKIISLLTLENGHADETDSDLAKRIASNQDFMRFFIPPIQGIVSVFSNVEKAQAIIEEGFVEFVYQALENSQGSSSYGYALKIIGGMLEKISALVSGKVLLNKKLLTSLIQAFSYCMERKPALETLPFQQKLIYRNSMDYIEGFLPQLCSSFTSSLSNKNQNWLDKFPNSSLDSLVETLLNEMTQSLDSFDPVKIQALSCQSLNNYFAQLLSLYEALSIYYLKSKPQGGEDSTAEKILAQFIIFLNMHPFKLFLESDLPQAKEFKSKSFKDLLNSISAYTFSLIQQENLCQGQDFSKIFPTPSDLSIDNNLASIISTLLTKLSSLESLIKNIGQGFTFPHHFVIGIYHTSLFIMNKLISSPNAVDLLQDTNNLLPLISRILLSSLTSSEACTENLWNTLNLSISQWVSQLWTLQTHFQTVHLLSLSSAALNPLLTFIQMGLHIQPQEIQPLLFDSNSIFYEILSSNVLPKDKTTENIIFRIFYFFLQDSLPLTLSLELAIKRKILPNQTLPLSSVQKELSVDSKTLSFILSDPFILVHNDSSKSEPLAITSSNISSVCIKINSKSEDPQLEIQRILKSLSPRAIQTLDILLLNLLEDHLYNLSEKTQSETEDEFLKKRKETCHVFQTLTSLLYKYPHLILYLIYQEKDYRSLLQKYQGKVYFIPENLEEYQNITFLDILHKTRFGIYNPQNTLLLIKAFNFSYIGVPIKDPANKMPFRDISMIVSKHLFDFLSKILKDFPQENSTNVWQLETSLTYYLVLAGFLTLIESLNKRFTQEEVNLYFKEQIDKLLNGILKAFIFFKDHPSYLAGPIVNCLNMVNARILGIRYYHELNIHGISDSQLDKFKLYNFQECLNVQPELSSLKLPTLENNLNDNEGLNSQCQVEKASSSSSSLSLVYDFPDKFDQRNDLYPTTKWPYFISETTALFQVIKEKNPNPPTEQANLLFYLQNINYHLGKTTASPTSVLGSFDDKLRFILHEKYKPTSEKKEENFNNLIEGLNLQAISRKPTTTSEPTKEISPAVPVSYPEETKTTEVYQPRSALWLDYFLNTEIISEEDFKNKQRAIRGELKHIHEKAYSSRISFDHKTHDQETEQMITNEILEKITKSTKFETSLIYTCIEEFNTLKNFPYPPEYPDIQREYARIQEDFSIYLVKLIECRDSGAIDDIMIDDRQQVPIGFKFCTDDENKIPTEPEVPTKEQQNPTFDHAPEKFLQGCQKMCHFEDEAIKGLISMLYIHPIPQHNFYELLESACKSPKVAVKILDYILTFLYCKIPLIQDYDGSFPFKTIPGETTFENVAKNMLKFLERFMKQNISLLFQPRSILEEYGLPANLEKIKLDQNYLEKTKDSITCMDLLIGILSDDQIKEKQSFINGLDAIIKSEKDLKIIDDDDDVSQSLQKGVKAITSQSCKIFTKGKTPKELSSPDFTRFAVYNYKRFVQEIAENIPKFTTQLEQVIPKVKSALANQDSQQVQKDIEIFNCDSPEPEKLNSLSEFFSSSLSVWMLSKNKASGFKTQISDEINLKMLNTLCQQILQEKLFEDFMIHLLELSSALLDDSLKDITDIRDTLECFIQICLHFYAIIIIQKFIQKSPPEEDLKEMTLPVLSNVKSTESAHDLETLPKVAYTFSEVKRSRQFDMEILLTDIFRKYSSQQMSRIIYKTENDEQGNQVLMDEIFIICKTLPFVLSFKDKKDNLLNEFTDEKYKLQIQDDYRQIKIDRDNLLETSIAGFTNKPQKEIKQTLEVQYFEEEGFDGGGLSREWFTLVSKEIFDPRFGLFRYSTNKMSIQPSPSSRLIPSHLKYMEFAGMLVAKAIRDEAIIDVTFTKSFLKHILRRNIAFNDLEDVDLDLSKNLKWMLENSVEGLEQCFTYETELMGQYHTIELVPDGYDFVVTDGNKKDYMRKICENKMKNEIALELGAFMKGFDLLISPRQLALFSPSELQLLISGCQTVDVADIKKHAVYNGGFNDQSPQIIWLWEILESFSQKELGAFVYFVSGSPKVRCESLESAPFCFRKVTIDAVSLPVAHTCYLELEIPVYTTKEELSQKLLLAIFEGQESFQLY